MKKRFRSFSFIVFCDKAPLHWVENLYNENCLFTVSPIHYDNKPHYHVLLTFENCVSRYHVCELYCRVLELPHLPYYDMVNPVESVSDYYNFLLRGDGYGY